MIPKLTSFDVQKRSRSSLVACFSLLCLITAVVLLCLWSQMRATIEETSTIAHIIVAVDSSHTMATGRNNTSNEQINTAYLPIESRDSHYWRTIDNSKGVQLKLFSAYYDDRVEAEIYLLGYENHNMDQKYYCVFGYENGDNVCLNQTARRRKGNFDIDPFKGYKITFWAFYYICKLPVGSHIPIKASLSLHSDCTMKSDNDWLPIKNRVKPDKSLVKTFAVCIHSPLYNFKDPQYVVEFIELHRALGAEIITIYIQDADELVWNILEQYQREDFVEVINWNLSFIEGTGYYHYKGQSLLVNDCMYRNMYRVQYLAMNDLDEAIVPQGNMHTWSDMLPSIDKSDYGGFQFRHAPFSSRVQPLPEENLRCSTESKSMIKAIDQPRFATRTQHAVTGGREKLIIKPQCLITASFHWVLLLEKYHVHKVPPETALSYHFRVPAIKGIKKFVEDNRLMTLFPTVLEKVRERLCNAYV